MAQRLGNRGNGHQLLVIAALCAIALHLLGGLRGGQRLSFVGGPPPSAEVAEASQLRRALLLSGIAAGTVVNPLVTEEARAQAPAPAIEVDIPDRIKDDPYDLVGVTDLASQKQDEKEFYIKKKYRDDTYQVLKHMKISGSLDRGAPNMEKWNKRVKEEMDDWVALYRRQESSVGRQSYYQLYSAINTLASHIVSYGPKFPFPSKRRQRFYELIQNCERYLEKGK